MTRPSSAPGPRGIRFSDLPLVWKLLVPYLALLVAVGSFGAFLIVRDLSSRAEAALDRELSRRSVDASSYVHEQELYALESANLAANLQGMASSLQRSDRAAARRLLQSVVALKPDLSVVVVADRASNVLSGFGRRLGSVDVTDLSVTSLSGTAGVAEALSSTSGAPSSRLLTVGGQSLLAVVAPVCVAAESCTPSGVALVGIDLGQLAQGALGRAIGSNRPGPSAATFYDGEGRRVASAGAGGATEAPSLPRSKLVRRAERAAGQQVSVLYAPLELQGRVQATLAVSAARRPAFAAVGAAGWRVGLTVIVAILGVVAIGVVLSRFIIRQVRPLLETNRALGAGDLTARAPVHGNDELGELARGVNQMADQLQSSYETLEERVRDRTEEVERLLQERTDLFASVSHEFRTPLAVILAQAEAMQDDSYPKTPRWCTESGNAVERSARQLLTFVNDVLDLARSEVGEVEVDLEAVHLPVLVREARGMLDQLVADADVTLSVRMRRDLPPVLADPTRLEEIIVNLVDNAAKYTPAGGKVELVASNGNGRIEVSVSDTGVGIPPEIGERVFEPFFRVKGTRAERGQPSSGLGLAITKRLVEAQGGAIWSAPRAGGGTTFFFSLPVADHT